MYPNKLERCENKCILFQTTIKTPNKVANLFIECPTLEHSILWFLKSYRNSRTMNHLGSLLVCLAVPFTLCHDYAIAVDDKTSNGGPGGGWNQQLPSGFQVPRPCLDPSQIKLATNVDPNFVGRPRNFYYAGGSGFGMNLYAQTLLGRNPYSLRELGEMCPEVFVYSPDSRFVSGYGKMFRADCFQQDSNTTTKCYVNKSSETFDEGVNVNIGIQNKKYYLTETDNKNYIIFLTCVNDQYADYQIVTTRPYVSPSEAAAFVSQINAAKFPLSQSILLACQIKKNFLHHYPYPFGNYPFSPSDYHNNTENGHGWPQSNGEPSGPQNGWSKTY